VERVADGSIVVHHKDDRALGAHRVSETPRWNVAPWSTEPTAAPLVETIPCVGRPGGSGIGMLPAFGEVFGSIVWTNGPARNGGTPGSGCQQGRPPVGSDPYERRVGAGPDQRRVDPFAPRA
jgi:hypothetical protein